MKEALDLFDPLLSCISDGARLHDIEQELINLSVSKNLDISKLFRNIFKRAGKNSVRNPF